MKKSSLIVGALTGVSVASSSFIMSVGAGATTPTPYYACLKNGQLLTVTASASLHCAVGAQKITLGNIDGANFASADLDEATVGRAVGGNFAGAHLIGATFYGAELRGANFAGTWLSGASFQNATLIGTNFTGVSVAGTNLSGANFTGANTPFVTGTGYVTSYSGITCPDGGATSGAYICTGWS